MNLLGLFSISDEQAMWRVQMNDDGDAFALLMERWEGPIQNLCTRMLGDRHRGEDLSQEAFTRVFARRKDYVASGKFSTFLWRIALNLCYDELRKRERRNEISLAEETDDGNAAVVDHSTPDVAAAHRETAELVRLALMKLPELYRSVLVLKHYEGLKFREIAEVLGIPEGTVKSRTAEALAQMGRLLGRENDEATGARPAQSKKEVLAL
jgi:RNA polymerase sigma-70 factor (ECF subfamily)